MAPQEPIYALSDFTFSIFAFTVPKSNFSPFQFHEAAQNLKKQLEEGVTMLLVGDKLDVIISIWRLVFVFLSTLISFCIRFVKSSQVKIWRSQGGVGRIDIAASR